MDGRELVEVRPATGVVGVHAVDGLDANEAPVLLALLGRARDAGHAVAAAQAEAAYVAGADVDVVRAGHEAAAAHEAIAVLDEVEDAGGVALALLLGLALHDLLDELFPRHAIGVGHVEVATDPGELVDVLLLEFLDVHRSVVSVPCGIGGALDAAQRMRAAGRET